MVWQQVRNLVAQGRGCKAVCRRISPTRKKPEVDIPKRSVSEYLQETYMPHIAYLVTFPVNVISRMPSAEACSKELVVASQLEDPAKLV